MSTTQKIALSLLIPFLFLTAYALYSVGLLEIFAYHLRSPAGWQVFTDLVISLIIVLNYMIPELRSAGKSVWPWIAGTLMCGSIAPLCYLVFARKKAK